MVSLHKQLLRISVGLMGLLVLSLWLIGHLILKTTLTDLLASRLQHDAETLLAAVRWDTNGRSFERTGLAGVYEQVRSGHYYLLATDDGALIRSRSLWDMPLTIQRPEPGQSVLETRTLENGEVVLLHHAGYRKQGHRLWISVAENIETLGEAERRFNLAFFLAAITGALLLLLLQRWQIRRVLRPLKQVHEQLAAIDRGTRDHISTNLPIEIQPLIDAFNQLLARNADRIRRSRHALGNLAHALKGPVNLIRQDIEHVKEETLRRELTSHVQRIQQLTERELRRARIAGQAGFGSPFQPQADLPELIRLMERTYPERNIHLEIRNGDGDAVRMDREDALELIGSLLENACQWARKEVRIRFEATPKIHLCIEDDGPGIPENVLQEQLLTRGQRLDESNQGYGLGLAIVQDIVAGYGGKLTIQKSPNLGGLKVEITL